jgi:hypothetical protein
MGDWKLQVSESSATNGHKSPYLVTLSRDDRTIYLGDAINRTSAEEILEALELWAQPTDSATWYECVCSERRPHHKICVLFNEKRGEELIAKLGRLS